MPAHKPADDTITIHHDDQESPQRRHVISSGAAPEDEPELEQDSDGGGEREDSDEAVEEDDEEEGGDSDGSCSEDDLHKLPEWVPVDLSTVRVNVQCPICLGIIKKTRTMMDCLHRFCRECIDKSMRMGNNECPACRKHCASRRSLRDDPRFDTFVESLFGDVEKYEKMEQDSDEEAKIRNKQIQDSIAKICQKQNEAVAKKRNKLSKGTNSTSETRKLRKYHSYTRKRGRRNDSEESEDNEDNNEANKELSSNDERKVETKKKRYKRRNNAQPSPSAANSDSEGIENELISRNKEIKVTPCGPMRTPEMLSWGGAGARSKCSRNPRLRKLTKYLENKKDNDLEYVASEMQLLDNDVDILLVKKHQNINDPEPSLEFKTSMMQILEGQKTLSEIRSESASNEDHLILACRLKK